MDCVGRDQFINDCREDPQTRHIILPRPGYSASHTTLRRSGWSGVVGQQIEKTARNRVCAGKRDW